MKKVLILSKSCGNGLKREQIECLFNEEGVHVDFINPSIISYAGYDGIVVGMAKADEAFFQSAPDLKVIMKFGVGLENIDRDAAAKRGIQVLNMPGINSQAVAEMAFSLMTACARDVVRGDRCVRAGQWPRLTGTTLFNKTLGIIGTGAIGTALAGMSRGFEMRVIGSDPIQNEAFCRVGGRYVDFDELIRTSDFISVHAPLTKSTFHMISDREFANMKQNVILINTARGPLVDEDALFRALRQGKIAAAGLDVFEQEPIDKDNKLLQLDTVVLLPHIAAFSLETMIEMDRTCAKVMCEALNKDYQ